MLSLFFSFPRGVRIELSGSPRTYDGVNTQTTKKDKETNSEASGRLGKWVLIIRAQVL